MDNKLVLHISVYKQFLGNYTPPLPYLYLKAYICINSTDKMIR